MTFFRFTPVNFPCRKKLAKVEEPRVKKTKKEKDPSKLKGASTAFFLFMTERVTNSGGDVERLNSGGSYMGGYTGCDDSWNIVSTVLYRVFRDEATAKERNTRGDALNRRHFDDFRDKQVLFQDCILNICEVIELTCHLRFQEGGSGLKEQNRPDDVDQVFEMKVKGMLKFLNVHKPLGHIAAGSRKMHQHMEKSCSRKTKSTMRKYKMKGIRIQASIKLENMNKFLAVLDEGSCYRITDFGVGENGGKFPLLNHRYKLNFYRNTIVTRVIHFDQNMCGFKLEPLQNFTTRRFGNTNTVDKASVINCLFSTKLYLDDNIPEIVAFKQRYLRNNGEDEKNHAISLFSPMKKEVTIEDFLLEYDATVYAKVHKIIVRMAVLMLDAKDLGIIHPSHQRRSNNSGGEKAMKLLKLYKVIVRVIDQTGSASLLLFDDMISQLVGVPCYKLKEQYGANAENTFPEELTNNNVGKRLLLRATYSEYNISNNNHVYQVKMMSENPEFITHFKKDFIIKDDDVLETLAPTVGTKHSKLQYQDSLPFNLEVTSPSAKEKERASSAKGNEDHQVDKSTFFVGSNENGKRTVIDLDEYGDERRCTSHSKRCKLTKNGKLVNKNDIDLKWYDDEKILPKVDINTLDHGSLKDQMEDSDDEFPNYRINREDNQILLSVKNIPSLSLKNEPTNDYIHESDEEISMCFSRMTNKKPSPITKRPTMRLIDEPTDDEFENSQPTYVKDEFDNLFYGEANEDLANEDELVNLPVIYHI
nr:replication protein A 70 kDa DNA-binding subunit B [Tanacetum cinerariifolium]